MSVRSLLLIPLAILILSPGASFAFAPVEELEAYEVYLPGEKAPRVWTTESLAAGRAFAEDFLRRYGGAWRVQWNETTGFAHQLFGSGAETAGAISSPEDAERAGRRFLLANPGLFGASDENFRLRTTTRASGKWSAVFDEVHDGIPVRGGRAHVVMTETGRIFNAGSDLHPGIDLSTAPLLAREEAAAIAGLALGFRFGTDIEEGIDLEILPIERDGGLSYRLVYAVRQRMESPFGLWETLVDASSGEILRRENLIRFFDIHGNTDGDIYDPHYCGNPLVEREYADHFINFTGLGTATSGADGDFSISGASGSVAWNAYLRGPWANVQNYSGAEVYKSGSVSEGQFLQIHWGSTDGRADERTCFYHTNRVHDYIRAVDPGPGLADIDYQMVVTVARTDGYCPGNAWYDWANINFCSAGSGYGNTGEMADVIYHEYGHGITHRIYNTTSSPSSTLHEGNSDIIANLLTGESIIGLGFYLNNCTSGIRNSDNTLIYPDDLTGSGHHDGQIIAGVVWDAWQELQASLGEEAAFEVIGDIWHNGRSLTLPTTQPDQVLSMLIADDDDGNLMNGTPHYAAICTGAANHGFSCSDLIGTTPEIEVSPASFEVTVNAGASAVRDLFIMNVGTGVLTYGIAGVQTTLAKTAGADPGLRGLANAESGTPDNARTLAFLQKTRAAGKLSAVVFYDDMESGVNGWTSVLLDGSIDNLWHQVTANYNSPNHSWWCGIDAQGNYDTGRRISNALVSPSIDLAGATPPLTLEFYETFSTETGYDFCNVGISTNGGATWTSLRGGTSGSSGGWRLVSLNLTPYAGQVVKIRFHFDTTDALYNQYSGWFIDDVSVLATGVSWLSFDPPGGAIPAGHTDTVAVTFDATALATGDYAADIRVGSDDESTPVVLVPVVLHVGSGIDPDLSTIAVNDDVMLRPDGLGDSVLAITVTVRDGSGNPVAGIPAGDVAVTLDGASLNGRAMKFCASGTDELILYSTEPTNASGEVTFEVEHAGGCGEVTVSAVVQAIALTNPASGTVRSPDLNGDGQTNFQDTMLYAQLLNAGTGYCGNLNGSPDGAVNFQDTIKYAQALAAAAACP
ncbi:MAG: choice-of-anchor J domain-containing protein [Candidatus Eisenbacteria bacterium]|nr:choice-of-anchor J domain-containing protein [Candidatus Eisenbacteria bacterium]